MILLIILILTTIAILFNSDELTLVFIPFLGAVAFTFAMLIAFDPPEHQKDLSYTQEEVAIMKAELEGYKKAADLENMSPGFYEDLNQKIAYLETETSPEVWEKRQENLAEKKYTTHFNLEWYYALLLALFYCVTINPLALNMFELPRNIVENIRHEKELEKKEALESHEVHPLIGGWHTGDKLRTIDHRNIEFVSFRDKKIYYKGTDGQVKWVRPYKIKSNITFAENRLSDYLVNQEDSNFYVTRQREFAREHLV